MPNSENEIEQIPIFFLVLSIALLIFIFLSVLIAILKIFPPIEKYLEELGESIFSCLRPIEEGITNCLACSVVIVFALGCLFFGAKNFLFSLLFAVLSLIDKIFGTSIL